MLDGIKTIDKNGIISWLDLDKQHHRLFNLPAIIFKDGDRSYLIEGKYHRTNGHAFTCHHSGCKEYYINGIKQKDPEQYTLWISSKEII